MSSGPDSMTREAGDGGVEIGAGIEQAEGAGDGIAGGEAVLKEDSAEPAGLGEAGGGGFGGAADDGRADTAQGEAQGDAGAHHAGADDGGGGKGRGHDVIGTHYSPPRRRDAEENPCQARKLWNNRASPVLVERDLVDSSLKAYAHPGTGNRSGRREGHAAISAHEGKGQTGRTVRGQVSHHRLRSEQFHQFGNLLGLRADAVPQPVAAAAPERGLAVRGTAEDAVRHSGAGADAVAGRDVVSGDG